IMVTAERSAELAHNPNPPNRAVEVPSKPVLSWTPGEYVEGLSPKHKVLLSDNFDDVTNGTAVVATQDANSFDAAGLLDFNTTYYWRIDEANSTTSWDHGNVWQFTTELIAYPFENVTATASSQAPNRGPETTVNGSGLDETGLLHGKDGDNNMWLSDIAGPQPTWIEFEFDKAHKLHEMWIWNSNDSLEPMIGFGFKDVVIEYSINGTDYMTLGTTAEFARAPGAPGYAHNTTIDFTGVAAKYVRFTANSNWGGILNQYGLSEVRFFHIPVQARNPYPDSGAAGVPPDVVLGWRAGREAVTHDVYVSTDEQAVMDGTAPVATVTETSYGPLSLDLDVTHYWKVNEVNEAETPSTWESDIWSFTTNDHIVVDDFESYNDLDPEDPASKRIFNVWLDGYGIATNGSLVGYENPPFCEKTIVHGGKQSMPLAYSNTGGAASSEAELTLTPAQDWTVSGVKTLAVHFHGTEGNTGQLYLRSTAPRSRTMARPVT
ncbi:MAG: discoidin domain-containing protein, partial [Planctomycetota bacterium]